MSIVCAATNCKYSSEEEDSTHIVFINFPNDDTAKIWANNCGRADLIMKSNEELHLNYYICSHHIEDRYYINKANPVIIEQGAIPTLFAIETAPEKSNGINIFDRVEQPETSNNVGLAYCDMNVEIDQYHGIAIRLAHLCRLCGEPSTDGIEIFAGKGIELRLKDKICLHMPISVNVEDAMPQKVCIECYNKLEMVHSLVMTCLKTDMRLRRFLNDETEPEYDNKYNTLVEECSLDIAQEMCINEAAQNNSLSFSSDKVDETEHEVQNTLKDCSNTNDMGQVQIINTSSTLENENADIQNIKINELSKTEIQLQLNKIVDTYKDVQNEDVENITKSLTDIEKSTNGKECYEIMCFYCKDTFKTQEIFENHKILCDEGGVMEYDRMRGRKQVQKEIKKVEAQQLSLFIETCNDCNQVFNSKGTFDEHKLTYCKSAVEIIHCQFCGRSFETQGGFDTHECIQQKNLEYNSMESKKACGHCQATFPTRKELSNHIIEYHEGQPLFKCFACDKTYEKWSGLDVHEATHRMDKPYLCDLCGKSFKHSNNLRGHKRIHLDESKKKRHVCEVCGNAFRSRFHLREHMNQHNGNKPYACEQCGKAFYKRIQLRQHKLSHGLNRYSCPICGVTFNRRGNMSMHVKRHSNGDSAYTCSVCTYRCKSMSELKMHRKKHTEQEIIESIRKKCSDKIIWQCKICSRVFSKRTILQNHERVHAGDKTTVECDECGKKLASKNSLLYHKKSIHSKERPHMCQYCGESFVSKEARLIHERIHTGERPYICKICNMQYRCSSNLSQHMKIHSDVKPHKCQYCSKSFTRKGALNVHERIHTGVKPYPCEVCGRTFSQKNDMLKHTKTHNVKSLKCEQCDEVLASKKELLKHIAVHEQDTSVVQEYVEVPQELQNYSINISCSTVE